MQTTKIIPIVFIIVLALGVTWGSFQALEQVSFDYTVLRSTGITWHPLSNAYSTGKLLIGIQPVNIQFNTSATEKKFVIEIAGSDTSYHLDLAFYDTGIIDVVETSGTTATKLTDTSSSGINWQNVEFIVVEINGTSVKVETDNGTVLASATLSTSLDTVEQIGGSGGLNALTGGTVYVAILYDPYSEMSETIINTMSSMFPLIIALIGIAIPLIFIKYIMKFLEKIMGSL